jgi:uncharacterized protein involved in type VI secretion and phage assembly
MSDPFADIALAVKLDKEWIPDDLTNELVEVRIERELQVPARCSVRFMDVGYKLLASGRFKLGSELSVFYYGKSLVDVEVTGISADQESNAHPTLNVVGHDKGHRLGRSTSVKSYTNMAYGEIVSQVASRCGLSASAKAPPEKLDYVLQVDSDFDFLTQLARRLGCDWWVEEDTLHFQPPVTTAQSTLAVELAEMLSFSVRATGHHPDKITVEGWDRKAQDAVTHSVTTPSSTLRPSSPFADVVKNPGKAFEPTTLVTAGLVASSPDEAKQLSEAIRDRLAAASVTARGMIAGASAGLVPGKSIDVTGEGPLAGKYHLTKVEVTFGARGISTRFVAGDRTPTSLVDALAGAANGSRGGAFQHPGLVVGEVTNINDPEHVGRVKMRYSGVSEIEESAWARVVSLGGGKSRGAVFLPEVGDEVLVGFESGDLRQPVVLGGLFGDKSTMPTLDATGGEVPTRRITSRLGHAVELSDGKAPAQQHILLQLDGAKHTFRLGKDKVDLEVPSGTPISIKAGDSSVAFGQDGSISVEGTNVTIKAQNKLALEGAQVAVKANAQLSIEGVQTALKGTVTQIDGTGSLALKGGIVQIN